ncbi:MAG: aldo/keto reductase [Candidatus Hydrogenedentes bacterium]|nr:aldo/keto reductase [Candidatus Hydrogenedentota bacterium]
MSFLNTKVEPSRICLGAAVYGTAINRKQSFALLDTFAACGGTFLDTAHIYAAWLPNGQGMSERTLGEWLRVTGMRDRMVVATKGGHPPLDDVEAGACSRATLEQHLSESLRRLEIDTVDLYWLHRDDPARPAGEIVETLAAFAGEGRIGAFGGSNWTWPRLVEANEYARAHHLPGMAASQPGWALADRAPGPSPVAGMLYLDEATRRKHVGTGLPLVAYTSQARGYFGAENVQWAKSGFPGTAPRAPEYDSQVSRGRLMRSIELANQMGYTPNQIALAYILNQPFPTYAVIGTSRVETVKEACAAVKIRLTVDECAYLRDGAT